MTLRRPVVQTTIATLLLCSSLATSHTRAADPPTKIRIVVIGDSTVASYPNPPADRPDLTGWGQVLDEFLTDRTSVVNHARSGRSSKSFIREGLWKKALAAKPDYVLIQFGHNDCPGKKERSTDAKTDFRDYLRTYVDETRAAGAKPVLVTPMTRFRFVDGKISSILRPYADAMLVVGKEKNVPVVDLHRSSVAMLNKLGDDASRELRPSEGDRTHFSRKGALAMARLVSAGLREVEPGLRGYLRVGE